jgi:hypothetical protein
MQNKTMLFKEFFPLPAGVADRDILGHSASQIFHLSPPGGPTTGARREREHSKLRLKARVISPTRLPKLNTDRGWGEAIKKIL